MKEINEAEIWLSEAKGLLESEIEKREKYTIAVAAAIHSLIRANDAMTLKFLNRTARRQN